MALRQYFPNIKIAVGFGISTLEQAQYVSCIADGVIIGSKLVSTLENQGIQSFGSMALQFANQIHVKRE